MTPVSKKANGLPAEKWRPIMYATYYKTLMRIARRHGYALALHGSMVRDMDIIAIPWTDDAGKPEPMLMEMARAIGWSNWKRKWFGESKKPHGRRAFTLLSGGGTYMDISVMPLEGRK